MADDSIEVVVPLQNRCSDPPSSSTGYEFKVLSHDQKKKLNDLKIRTIRENHLYLKEHPEIIALVTLLLTALYKNKPKNVRDFLAAYMKRPQLRLAVEALVEKQQQLSTRKSSVKGETRRSEAGKPPFSLANIVFPSSLKVEDYQVEEVQQVDREAVIIGEDIASEILTRVEEKIIQIENYRMAQKILGDVVTDFKPTMYPPCEPQFYRHTLSEKERKAKEPTYVAEGIKEDLLNQVDETITQDEEFVREIIDDVLTKIEITGEE